MKIRKRQPALNEPCPDCGQGSALFFIACPSCGHVMVICGEVGSPAFPDPCDLEKRLEPHRPCPECGLGVVEEFPGAQHSQIIEAGISEGAIDHL